MFNTNTEVSLEELDERIDSRFRRLSLEANFINNTLYIFEGLVSDITSKIKNFIPSFITTIKTEDVSTSQIKLALGELKKYTKLVAQVDYDNLLVSVPEGFNGNMLDYLNTLDNMSSSVYSKTIDLLSEYKLILATFINSKDEKIAIKDNTFMFKKAKHDREDFIKRILKFFPAKNHTSKVLLGTIIHRFSDLDKLAETVYKMNKDYNRANLETINSLVSEIVDLLDIININVENGSITNVSGAASKNISEGAFELAQTVEFVSVFTFRKQQASTSVANIITDSISLFQNK